MNFLHAHSVVTWAALSFMSLPLLATEATPGANEFFQEFSACKKNAFVNFAGSRAMYEKLGEVKSIGDTGMWFNTKAVEKDSPVEIYRFPTPIKMHGLTVIAAGFSFYKGDGQGYGGGDATYWGMYFAETPKAVYSALRERNPVVTGMKFMGDHYANMNKLQADGDKHFEQGAIIEEDPGVDGAKSYFSCSIQYKIVINKK